MADNNLQQDSTNDLSKDPPKKDQSQEKKKVSFKRKGSPNGSLTFVFFPNLILLKRLIFFSVHSRSPSRTYRDPKKTSTAWDTIAS